MSVFQGRIMYIVLRGACRCSIFNFGVQINKVIGE